MPNVTDYYFLLDMEKLEPAQNPTIWQCTCLIYEARRPHKLVWILLRMGQLQF